MDEPEAKKQRLDADALAEEENAKAATNGFSLSLGEIVNGVPYDITICVGGRAMVDLPPYVDIYLPRIVRIWGKKEVTVAGFDGKPVTFEARGDLIHEELRDMPPSGSDPKLTLFATEEIGLYIRDNPRKWAGPVIGFGSQVIGPCKRLLVNSENICVYKSSF